MTQRTNAVLDVTIIVPVYRNAETLELLFGRIREALEGETIAFEALFVDDACPEDSLSVLERLAKSDPRVAVIALEANIGQQRAIFVGLEYARGNRIVVMDADLQDPPEAIPILLNQLDAGFDAVFARRKGQYQAPSRLITARLFRAMIRLLTGLPPGSGAYVALSRKMAQRLRAFGDPSPYLAGMIGCTGLSVTSIPVERSRRGVAESAYSACSRWAVGINAIFCVMRCKWFASARSQRPTTYGSIKALIGTRFRGP